jgi:hypothetical protein
MARGVTYSNTQFGRGGYDQMFIRDTTKLRLIRVIETGE